MSRVDRSVRLLATCAVVGAVLAGVGLLTLGAAARVALAALGVIAVIAAGIAVVRDADASDRATGRPPESIRSGERARPAAAVTVAAGHEDQIARETVPDASVDRRARRQLLDAATAVVSAADGLTRTEARRRVEAGTWTDDPRAGAFLADRTPPVSVRLRDWLVNARRERAVRATVRAIDRRASADGVEGAVVGGDDQLRGVRLGGPDQLIRDRDESVSSVAGDAAGTQSLSAPITADGGAEPDDRSSGRDTQTDGEPTDGDRSPGDAAEDAAETDRDSNAARDGDSAVERAGGERG